MINEIVQAIPAKDYKVYIYFVNGKIKLYDTLPLLEKGVFRKLYNSLFSSVKIQN